MRIQKAHFHRLLKTWAIVFCLAYHTAALSKVNTGTDESAQLPFWEIQHGMVNLRLVQRLPDQTRGFFEARGFNKTDSELIAQSCVFQTVFKNSAGQTSKDIVEYDIREWIVTHKGKQSKLITREEWEKEWQNRKVSKPARIAFEWALIPTRQKYQPQDYNWGMTMYGLKPGSQFDLELRWKENGSMVSTKVNNIKCAADISPEPDSPFK